MTAKPKKYESPQIARWQQAAHTVREQLYQQRLSSGHWEGELSPSALATATAISTFCFYLAANEERDEETPASTLTDQIAAGIAWLLNQQNDDGGWGDTPRNYSNISTTMLVVAALHAAGRENDLAIEIERAQTYIDQQGGIQGLRHRYGKDKTFAVPILANCALAGIVPWSEVSALPFEAACVPRRFYNWLQLPVVSYAIPALVAIGQAKFHFDPPWDPFRKTLRRFSIQRGLNVLKKMQPASGGYLEAIPLTSFVCMSLSRTGQANHPVVENGIRFLVESFRVDTRSSESLFSSEDGRAAAKSSLSLWERVRVRATENVADGELKDLQSTNPHPSPLPKGEGADSAGGFGVDFGCWPIDTNLATWNTTLAINALANAPDRFRQQLNEEPEIWQKCLAWLLNCQNTTVHPFTGAAPGGWGWSDLSGAVPDADDTPGALLALKNILESNCDWLNADWRQQIVQAAELGINWLLCLQNRDGGWPTFCKGWGKLPFDRSGSDITAHVIRGLLAWQPLASAAISRSIDKAIAKGFRYLGRQQREDGSWLPLWFGNQDQLDDENPCYGTAKVLLAYRDVKIRDAKILETEPAERGFNYLASSQSLKGCWGGGDWVTSQQNIAKDWDAAKIGVGSVEETALCTEALLASPDVMHQTQARAGIDWLSTVVESELNTVCSPIGFYFAKLWYFEALYPLIFAMSTFERALQMQAWASDNERTNDRNPTR